jgi:hypothetical protein
MSICSSFEFARARTVPQLLEQYLFTLFDGLFYLSFMAENRERLRRIGP